MKNVGMGEEMKNGRMGKCENANNYSAYANRLKNAGQAPY
jgi:hypothetical protein